MYRVTVGKGYVSIGLLEKAKRRKVEMEDPAEDRDRAGKSSSTTKPFFSRNSRNALIKALNGLKEPPKLFASLTYADKFKHDPKVWKSDIDVLSRRIRADFPASWFIWRLEPSEPSGYPHFHLLGCAGSSDSDDVFQAWLSARWYKITQIDKVKHPYLVWVKNVDENLGQLYRYMSKEETLHNYYDLYEMWKKAGPHWGKINKKNIPIEVETFVIDDSVVDEVKARVIQAVNVEIAELQVMLDAKTFGTPRRRVWQLETSIRRKKEYVFRLNIATDYFSVLDKEHIGIIKEVLQHHSAVKST